MRLTQQQLEAHLWGAANILRGKTAGQDYKNYILSLMFYKRLCDQWENEADEAIAELERQQGKQFNDAQKAVSPDPCLYPQLLGAREPVFQPAVDHGAGVRAQVHRDARDGAPRCSGSLAEVLADGAEPVPRDRAGQTVAGGECPSADRRSGCSDSVVNQRLTAAEPQE
jgi:hypothetical protein